MFGLFARPVEKLIVEEQNHMILPGGSVEPNALDCI